MAAVYDDVEIEDMDFDEEKQTYFYPCPCGDKFFITLVRGRGWRKKPSLQASRPGIRLGVLQRISKSVVGADVFPSPYRMF